VKTLRRILVAVGYALGFLLVAAMFAAPAAWFFLCRWLG
jgi:hypothetical protein